MIYDKNNSMSARHSRQQIIGYALPVEANFPNRTGDISYQPIKNPLVNPESIILTDSQSKVRMLDDMMRLFDDFYDYYTKTLNKYSGAGWVDSDLRSDITSRTDLFYKFREMFTVLGFRGEKTYLVFQTTPMTNKFRNLTQKIDTFSPSFRLTPVTQVVKQLYLPPEYSSVGDTLRLVDKETNKPLTHYPTARKLCLLLEETDYLLDYSLAEAEKLRTDYPERFAILQAYARKLGYGSYLTVLERMKITVPFEIKAFCAWSKIFTDPATVEQLKPYYFEFTIGSGFY